jgi:hypothetical protein
MIEWWAVSDTVQESGKLQQGANRIQPDLWTRLSETAQPPPVAQPVLRKAGIALQRNFLQLAARKHF